jgi:predicted GNAT superfamily acetyltransferase
MEKRDESLTEERTVETVDGVTLHLELRSLRPEEYGQCEELQKLTWGADFVAFVPAALMMILHKLDGVVAGAFDQDHRLVGLILGLTGQRDGHLCHWSHLAAVREELRGCGLGRHLKLLQRRLLLRAGVNVAEWTYEPLEARNAYLNLNRLGGVPVEYLRDVYGDGSTSGLHSGIGTDRLVVRWQLDSKAVEAIVAGRPLPTPPSWAEAPIANVDACGAPRTDSFELPAGAVLRIETPVNIQAVKVADLATAKVWRASTRRAFETALVAGFRVRILQRQGGTKFEEKKQRSFYVLTADPG